MLAVIIILVRGVPKPYIRRVEGGNFQSEEGEDGWCGTGGCTQEPLRPPPALRGKRLISEASLPCPHGYSGCSGEPERLGEGSRSGLRTHKQQGDLLWPKGITVSFM